MFDVVALDAVGEFDLDPQHSAVRTLDDHVHFMVVVTRCVDSTGSASAVVVVARLVSPPASSSHSASPTR
jgi:hypothetical protein